MLKLTMRGKTITDYYYSESKLLTVVTDALITPCIGESIELSGIMYQVSDIIHKPEALLTYYILTKVAA